MVNSSRIAVLQPRRAHTLVAALAQKYPDIYRNHERRLDNRSDDFDVALNLRAVGEYVEHLCGLLTEVGEAGCDLVLLPECTLPLGGAYVGGRDKLMQTCPPAETLWLERTAPLARRYEMLIASCYYRCEGERLYNDGILMDEKGEVAGIYHKVHLPCPLDWETSEACVFEAGQAHPVFETKVGNVGFQICYDIDFPEGCRCLALNGAQLVLHPTVGYAFPDEEEAVAEARLRTRATDNSITVAYANFGPSPGRSAVYGPSGNQIACCGRGDDRFVFADIDIRAPRRQDWGASGSHDHRDQLLRKRRPDLYGVLSEPRPPVLQKREYLSGRLYEYTAEVGLE